MRTLYIECSMGAAGDMLLDDSANNLFGLKLLAPGFRMVVFSVIIMVIVLFFRRGIMGDKELPNLLKRRKRAVRKGAENK